MKLRSFIRFDVIKAVDDASTDLQILGPLPEPPPSLQGARAHIPSASQINLVEVADRVIGSVTHRRSERGVRCRDDAGH